MKRMLPLLAVSLLLPAAAWPPRRRPQPPILRAPKRPISPRPRRRRRSAGEVIDDAKDATNAAIEAAKQAILKAIDKAKDNTGAKLDEGKKASEDALDQAHDATKLLDKAAEAAREVLDKAKQATSEVFDKAKDAAAELSKGSTKSTEAPQRRAMPLLASRPQTTRARAICASPSQNHRSGTNGLVHHGAGGGVAGGVSAGGGVGSAGAGAAQAQRPAAVRRQAELQPGPRQRQVVVAGSGV